MADLLCCSIRLHSRREHIRLHLELGAILLMDPLLRTSISDPAGCSGCELHLPRALGAVLVPPREGD